MIQRFSPDSPDIPPQLRQSLQHSVGPGDPIRSIHPAVARINCPDGAATYHGSGTLVAVGQNHGIVITNWHVVRDCRGQMTVTFPNGFTALAKVLRTDKVWDLAAVLIARPPGVEPVALADSIPRLGQRLTIAGYGGGTYREATGKLAQFCCPDLESPAEILEVSTGARFGDSGGPIFTQDRRLAGVLFGSAMGYTNGSHSGRVRRFLRETLEASPEWGSVTPAELAVRRRPTDGAVQFASATEPVN